MARRAGFITRFRAPVRRVGSRASNFFSSTATAYNRVRPYVAPAVAVATRARPKVERAVRFMMGLRRRNGSTTMVKTPGEMQMEYVRPVGDGNSVSYFTRKAMRLRGMKKRMARATPIRLAKTEIVNSVAWAYGRQSSVVILHNTNTELDTLTDSVTLNSTAKFLIQSTKVHYMITSGSKAGIKMRIYEGCYKRDTAGAFNPLVLWANGLSDTGTTETNQTIDAKPWSSPAFNAAIHITKVTNVYLAQGRTHEHYSTYGYNKLYDKEYFNAGGVDYLRGWTRFIMFTCYGEPVADTDADITTATGRVLIIGTKMQRFKFTNPDTYRATYVSSIPTVGVTSERLLDEGSGEIEVNAVL